MNLKSNFSSVKEKLGFVMAAILFEDELTDEFWSSLIPEQYFQVFYVAYSGRELQKIGIPIPSENIVSKARDTFRSWLSYEKSFSRVNHFLVLGSS